MDARQVLDIGVSVVLIVLCLTGVWALAMVALAARSATRLVEDLDAKLPPLIDKASTTLDEVNIEMARVDGLVTQLEEVSDRVTSTTRAASEIVGAPAAAVAGLGDRARRFFSILTGRPL
jgi:predicted PurR-regulated permease PerM